MLRRFFATLSTGDFAAIGEFFGDDSVWMAPAPPRPLDEVRALGFAAQGPDF